MVTSKVNLYSKSLDGHRDSYVKFTEELLDGKRTGLFQVLCSKKPALFLMIEEAFWIYFLIALLRSLLGRRTVGLLFRPLPAIDGKTLRLKTKRFILSFMKKFNNIKTISIVPATLDERISWIVDDWIYDFQLWDIKQSDFLKFKDFRLGNFNNDVVELCSEILKKARGRKIVTTIGTQNYDKGFDKFVEVGEKCELLDKYFFVSAGKISSECVSYKEKLNQENSFVVDRFLSDDEIIALYAISSLIWCCYSKNYDQASGILGRAVQFCVPVVVRSNSLSHKFCQKEKINFIDFDSVNFNLFNEILTFDKKSENSLTDFKSKSVSSIKNSLFL